MKKIALISLCSAALFTACGDDDSSANVKQTSDASDIIAKTFADLPDCSDALEGTFAYIKDEKQAYTCHNKAWTPEEPTIESSSSSSKVSSSSEASGSKESSSSAKDEPSSSETEAPSSSAESSSSAEPESSAESSSSEESSSSVVSRDIKVGAYQYETSGMESINVSIYNNEDKAIDSLTLRLYFTGTPEQVEKCATLINYDICQSFDEEGHNKPCSENERRDIINNLRNSTPIRFDESYDSTSGTYSYYYDVPLGSTTIESKFRFSLNLDFSLGLETGPGICDVAMQPAKKKFSKDSSDWSWMAHQKEVDGADFEGIPLWEKDQGDTAKAPINPYISIYSKDDHIYGISPKF